MIITTDSEEKNHGDTGQEVSQEVKRQKSVEEERVEEAFQQRVGSEALRKEIVGSAWSRRKEIREEVSGKASGYEEERDEEERWK